jgi:hypothetical protein
MAGFNHTILDAKWQALRKWVRERRKEWATIRELDAYDDVLAEMSRLSRQRPRKGKQR